MGLTMSTFLFFVHSDGTDAGWAGVRKVFKPAQRECQKYFGETGKPCQITGMCDFPMSPSLFSATFFNDFHSIVIPIPYHKKFPKFVRNMIDLCTTQGKNKQTKNSSGSPLLVQFSNGLLQKRHNKQPVADIFIFTMKMMTKVDSIQFINMT